MRLTATTVTLPLPPPAPPLPPGPFPPPPAPVAGPPVMAQLGVAVLFVCSVYVVGQ